MEGKIRVMHFVSGLVSGGVEQMLYNYCRFMDKEKFEFIIVYQHEPVETCKSKFDDIGCKTIRITARNENFIKNVTDGYKEIKRHNPDIVHAHMNLMNFCPLFAAWLLGIKIRISHSHIAERKQGLLFFVITRVCKMLNIIFSSTLMTCGREAGEYLYGKKKMSAGNILLIQNATDLEYYRPDDNAGKNLRAQLGIDNAFVLGHVGRFTEQKNHMRLLKIFTSVLELMPNAYLLLIGTGVLELNIKERAMELGISERVIFLGTTKDMNPVYSAMDVFVLPSLYEGFPVVSIEVQAAQIPSIFSDTIDAGCKLTNAIEFVSLEKSDQEWARIIIEKSRSFVQDETDLMELKQNYDIRPKAVRLTQIYYALLSNKGRFSNGA